MGTRFSRLKTQDFRLHDNASRTVHHFSTADLSFTMGLVLDRSGSMAAMIDEVYQAAYHTIRTMQECEQVCADIAKELRNQYSLAYYPKHMLRDGAWHEGKVELKLLGDLSSKG